MSPLDDPRLLGLATRWQQEGLAGPSERALLQPEGMTLGSAAHLRFLTLPRAVSALRDEVALWQAAQATWQDEATRWLFDSATVARADWQQVGAALACHELAQRRQEVRGWYGVARGVEGRFRGDVTAMIEAGGCRTGSLLDDLAASRATFPQLSGPTSARLWLDQLRRVAGIPIAEDPPLRLRPAARVRRVALAHALPVGEGALPVAITLALTVWAALPMAQRAAQLEALA